MFKKNIIYVVLFALSSTIFLASCGGDSGPHGSSLEISDISPDSGVVGTTVTIKGSGFVPNPSENIVTFNGTPAEVSSSSESEIVTKVPVGATSGPIEVEIVNIESERNNRTVTGPSFTIISDENQEELLISEITPTSGPPKSEVTITGCGFSLEASQNTVRFNETIAEVISVSDTTTSTPGESACGDQLIVIVPDNATTGPVQVSVGNQTATGSTFTVTTGGSNPPAISSFSPMSGPEGTEVTISGSGFSSDATILKVMFGNVEAPVLNASETEIITSVPVGAVDSKIMVTVEGLTDISENMFNVTGDGNSNAPFISNISPTSGPTGTEVTINGENFSSNSNENTVTFNGAEATITSASSTQIVATVPGDATTGPVEVITNGQTATGPTFTVTDGSDGDTPSIGGIDPTEGPAGTEVTITGTNFSSTAGDNTVTFGGTEATINSASATELVVVVPDIDPGTVAVEVTVGGQTTTGPDFTITDGSGGGNAPTIGAINPTSGPVGTEVTITGTNFSATASENTVTFGGTEATVNSATTTELIAVVPNGLGTGAVSVAVTVNGQTTTGPDFTVTDGGGGGNAPTIDAINPTSGPVGTEVTITGTNFSATASENTVTFGATEATVNSATTTELIAVVPNGLGTGAVSVAVTVNGQTTTGPDFTVTDGGGGGNAPTIDAINPTSGPISTEVTITGNNFGATPADNVVTFNGTSATINSASTTEIVAVVPNGATTGPVEVQTNGQTATGPVFSVIPDDGTPQFPITGSNASINSGSRGICLGCGITNEDNVVNSDLDDFAQVEIPAGIAGGFFVSVESAGNIPAGGDAGFVIVREGEVIGLDLLDQITITTFLDGVEQESNSGSSLLNLEVVSGNEDRSFISFNTSQEFDEIEIEFGGLASVSATYQVYAAYGGRMAAAVPGPTINSVSPLRGPVGTEVIITGNNFGNTPADNTVTFDGTGATITSASATQLVVTVPSGATSGPVEVTTAGKTATGPSDFTVGAIPLTGSTLSVTTDINGVCLGCSTANGANVVDESLDNFAEVELAVGVAASGVLTVSSTEDLSGGGQAGFVIARAGGLIDAGLLSSITVTTFLDGSEQEEISASSLLLLDLLSGSSTNRQFVGFDTTQDFDEIEVTFNGGVLSVDVTFQVYEVHNDFTQIVE